MAPESTALDAAWGGDDSRGGRLLIGGVVAVCLHVVLLGIPLQGARPGPGRPGTAIEVSLVAAASPPPERPIAPAAPVLPAAPPRVKPPPEKPVPRTKAAEPRLREEIAPEPTAERSPTEPVEPAVTLPSTAPLSGATGAGAPVEHAPGTAGSESLINARPRYKTNPKPRYPPIARRRRQEGVVLLAVSVDASGNPVTIEIQTSSGVSSLDEAAVDAVRHWEFEPGVLEGRAVPSRVEVPIRFELE